MAAERMSRPRWQERSLAWAPIVNAFSTCRSSGRRHFIGGGEGIRQAALVRRRKAAGLRQGLIGVEFWIKRIELKADFTAAGLHSSNRYPSGHRRFQPTST